jgi:5-methyltetrahydrofolate--homocysteine methyltransferase
MKNIKEILKERILVLDGAMGTMIQSYSLTEDDFRGEILAAHDMPVKGNNDLLSITRPDIIEEIHDSFLEAGADIIETNTFSSNSISQADYKCEHLVFNLNKRSAQIAKKSAEKYSKINPDKPRFVAGSMGPTTRTASMSPDVNDPSYRNITFEELAESYSEQVRALIEGGVDLLLIETITDSLNCKAAIFAISNLFDELGVEIPLMISGTIVDLSGRTLSGQTIEAFNISISHAPNLLSVGLNCALGSEQMRSHISDLSHVATCNVSLYPNAGLPDEFGEYTESPEFMAKIIKEYASEGFVNIVGGCCGTRPEHIGAMASAVQNLKPRNILARDLTLKNVE